MVRRRSVFNFVSGFALACALLAGCASGGGNAPRCGDNVLDPNEACEGFELRDATCGTEGFTGGRLGCTTSCELDTSGCFTCGDGSVDEGEAGDGALLGGAACARVLGDAYVGELGCADDCGALDTSACRLAEGPAPNLAACDADGGVPCADGLTCRATSQGDFCVEACTATADTCGEGRSCLTVESEGLCVDTPTLGERCTDETGCSDPGETCTPTHTDGSDVISTCVARCDASDIGATGRCLDGESCLGVPGGNVELQGDAQVACSAPGSCDPGFDCLDVPQVGGGSLQLCARRLAACARTIPFYGFEEGTSTGPSACDRGAPTQGQSYCGVVGAVGPAADAQCYALFESAPDAGVCLAFCDAEVGVSGRQLDCGIGYRCGVPSAPQFFFPQSDTRVPCDVGDTARCDGAHPRCVDLGDGLECARAVEVCIPGAIQ